MRTKSKHLRAALGSPRGEDGMPDGVSQEKPRLFSIYKDRKRTMPSRKSAAQKPEELTVS